MTDLPPFLNLTAPWSDFDTARVAILPIPYEGTVSYGGGTADGPRALLTASEQMEDYDEFLERVCYRMGIATCPAPDLPEDPADAVRVVYESVKSLLDAGKFPVILGGEHSISNGVHHALHERYPDLGVIQFDAHTDLRDAYLGTPYSHASVMARIRARTQNTLHLGIRAVSSEEIETIHAENIQVGFMHKIRCGDFDWKAAVEQLPETLFVTFDLDVMDLAIIRATGTPEPGGLTWDEATEMLDYIFRTKTVVGFDMLELCGGDTPSAYSAARLAYRMIGMAFPNS